MNSWIGILTMARDYRKVIAWQHANALTLAIYRQTKQFPSDERFGLTSQLRRAAYSIPANIVEGSARETDKEYLRYLIIARASLKETEYFLLLARDLGYLPGTEYDELTNSVNATFGALQGLIKAVKKEVGVVGRFQAFLLSTLFITCARIVSPLP